MSIVWQSELHKSARHTILRTSVSGSLLYRDGEAATLR